MTEPDQAAAITLSVEPVGSRARTVLARMSGYDRRATVHWGDTTTSPIDPNRGVLKTYDRDAAFQVFLTTQFRERPWPPPKVDVLASAPAVIREGLQPGIVYSHNTEWSKEQELQITFDDADLPGNLVTPVRILWPDDGWWPPDTLEQIVYPRHGDVFTRLSRPGTWDVTVADLGTGRRRTDPVTVPETIYDPDFTLAFKTAADDPAGLTVNATLTTVTAGRAVRIYWEAGAIEYTKVDNPSVGQVLPFTYVLAGYQSVQAVYDDIAESGDWNNNHGNALSIEVPRPPAGLAP
jgi:hypothetical protein